jgi:5-methylcytosine-specific restriction endonuclease McrA
VLAERFTDREIFERDGWVCGLCGGLVDGTLKYPDQMRASLDRILPLARGGHHTRHNTRCAHALCNSRKTNRLDSEVLDLFPYLRESHAVA